MIVIQPNVDPEEGSWWWVISKGILHKRASLQRDEVTPTENQPEDKRRGEGAIEASQSRYCLRNVGCEILSAGDPRNPRKSKLWSTQHAEDTDAKLQ